MRLYDSRATRPLLLKTLKEEAARPTVKEIDLIVMLHGLPDKLVFADGGVKTPALAGEIKALSLAEKLRLVYSTACFGLSHADDFVKAGFTAAVGAKAVNANAAAEFPLLLAQWGGGARLQDALAIADSAVTRMPLDGAAEAFAAVSTPRPTWAGQVNSTKGIVGDRTVRITTSIG